ncbi:MAG: ABC transporter ATP-binding protein, partial [Actinomycetia bacterium]|nr:ABC transporter ATP-binding protein [Actinomycetes bacterium]
MIEQLPVADRRTVRQYARKVALDHPRELTVVIALHAFAAIVGLVVPRLIGDLVEAVEHGTTVDHIDKIALVIGVAIAMQTVLTRYARFASTKFGENLLARLREDFVKNSLGLPLGTVERAGTGDLLTRTSRDVESLSWSVRFAVPEMIIAFVTVIFTIGASLLVGLWVAIPCLLGVPILWVGTRWYLRRAKDGYLRENASYASINATLAETVEGARTIETLGTQPRRRERIDADIAESYAAERYTLWLRTIFFPAAEMGYL